MFLILFTECYLYINAEKKTPEIKIDSSKSGQFCMFGIVNVKIYV